MALWWPSNSPLIASDVLWLPFDCPLIALWWPRSSGTGEWAFEIISEAAQGRTAHDNVDELQRFITQRGQRALPAMRLPPGQQVMLGGMSGLAAALPVALPIPSPGPSTLPMALPTALPVAPPWNHSEEAVGASRNRSACSLQLAVSTRTKYAVRSRSPPRTLERPPSIQSRSARTPSRAKFGDMVSLVTSHIGELTCTGDLWSDNTVECTLTTVSMVEDVRS